MRARLWMRGGRRLRERPPRPLEPRDPRRGLPPGAGEREGSVLTLPSAASALLGRGPVSAPSLPGQSCPRGSLAAAPPPRSALCSGRPGPRLSPSGGAAWPARERQARGLCPTGRGLFRGEVGGSSWAAKNMMWPTAFGN